MRHHFSLGAILALYCTTATPAAIAAEKARTDEATVEQGYVDNGFWSKSMLLRPATVDGIVKERMFKSAIHLQPGKHDIGLRIEFEARGQKYRDLIEFPMQVGPAGHYTAAGQQQGPDIEVWIQETKTQKPVTDILVIKIPKCKIFSYCKPEVHFRGGGLY